MAGIENYLNSYLSPYTLTAGSSVFDYNKAMSTAKSQADALLEKLNGGSAASSEKSTMSSLKADAANFLDVYTKTMVNMGQAAGALRGEGLDKLLLDKEGNITDETVGKTIDAVKNMVQKYNDGVKMLNDNATRGSGVSQQLERMVQAPASEDSMKLIGLSMNSDGTLKLDEDAMKKALTTDNAANQKLFKQVLGRVADGVKKDADTALAAPARSLIGNDLANIAAANPGNIYSEMMYSVKGNPYGLNNQAAVGMMLNMFA